MAMEPYKFPDEAPPAPEEKKDDELEISVEGEGDDVQVVDDTPPQDRGRKPLGKSAEEVAPDDEVEEYSAAVKKRIAELKHTYHDERRDKESAQRERDEAIRVAQAVHAENQRLRDLAQGFEKSGNDAKKETAEKDLATAQRALKAAYEAGDADEVVKATEAIADAKQKLSEAVNFKPAPLQPAEKPVQTPQQTQVRPDEHALRWFNANKEWYGKDEEMTSFALGLHQKLVNSGVDPARDPDTYYERLNTRLRQVFPEAFSDASAASEDDPPKRGAPPATVVAPASRTTAPKKIVLTKSQEAVAKKLGVPLKEYARQMRLLETEKR